MPIKIPNELPATNVLTAENIFVMTETRAITQDIRPPSSCPTSSVAASVQPRS